ncbi:MAG TPA: hypothetical protein VGE02_10400 [Gemmatimonadales bacterium]
MSDAAIFAIIIGGLFVLRLVAATVIFCWLLPAGGRCPQCDAPTLWIHSPVWSRIAPWLRTSWCPACGWEGMLRHGTFAPTGTAPVYRGRRQEEGATGPDRRGPSVAPRTKQQRPTE